MQEIVELDQSKGIDNLLQASECYSSDNKDDFFMIKRIGIQLFMGFVANKEVFNQAKIKNARQYFEN